MRAPAPMLALALAASLAAGCGDPDLWARYRAERGYWRAHRRVERIDVNPRAAPAAEYREAIRAYRQVAASFPPGVWTDRAHLGRPAARGVAVISGRAAIAAAEIEEATGDLDQALDQFQSIRAAYRELPEVALEATLARAAALERAGRGAEMAEAYAEVTREFPLLDPAGWELPDVLDAPIRIAREYAQEGHPAAADSTLAAAEARERGALRALRGRPGAVAMWTHLARLGMQRRRVDDALAALREALAEPGAAGAAPGIVMTLAEDCVAAGRPDSALAYAAWAERSFGDSLKTQAMVLTARIWERRGPPDSALAAWARVVDELPGGGEAAMLARYQRGRMLETLGRFEQARGQYRAMIAADPTHELSFAALGRIVAWHAEHGEKELARIEGRRGIESLEQVITTNHDEHVLEMARRTRAELLLDIEDWSQACTALSDLWNRYEDTESGLRAAQVAESRLRDRTRAVRLYRDLAGRATGEADRRAALDALARLERERG